MKTRALTRLSLFALLALSPVPGHAALVTWAFEGTVRTIDGTVAPPVSSLGVSVGAPMSGFLRFDSASPDTNSSVEGGFYDGLVDGAQVTIGSYTVTSIPGLSGLDNYAVVIVPPNDTLGSGAQYFQVDVSDPTGTYSNMSSMALELSAPNGYSFWTTGALPVDPPDLAQLDPFAAAFISPWGTGKDVALFLDSGSGPSTTTTTVRAELTSLVRVPEPGALALLALAGAALAARRITRA